jgi:hypothetical protein
MLVTGHLDNRQGRRQRARQLAQPDILRIGEQRVAGAFQLDAQREIIAGLPAAPARGAGMPGALAGAE